MSISIVTDYTKLPVPADEQAAQALAVVTARRDGTDTVVVRKPDGDYVIVSRALWEQPDGPRGWQLLGIAEG